MVKISLTNRLSKKEAEVRRGEADYTGRLCVIGSHLDGEGLEKLFELVQGE